jgi:hypothetical protein
MTRWGDRLYQNKRARQPHQGLASAVELACLHKAWSRAWRKEIPSQRSSGGGILLLNQRAAHP